jgi:hypothetical protein
MRMTNSKTSIKANRRKSQTTMPNSRLQIRRVGAVSLSLLCLTSAAATLPAEPLAHIELRIGTTLYSMKQPATMQESIAALQAQQPNLAEFGRAGVFDRIGFRQTFIVADKSAVEVGLLLPPELGARLEVGVHELGGTTIENYAGASSQGWTDKCPDLEENKPVLTIAHYGKPGPDAIPMPMVPNGDLERVYQTHHTRLRHDIASVRFKTVDLAHRWIEGVAIGEVSWIVPRDPDEVNNRKTYDWMCRVGEYIVKTEPFELHFALHVSRGWTPGE